MLRKAVGSVTSRNTSIVPPPGPVMLALAGAYPFVHFSLMLREKQRMQAHNKLVGKLCATVGISPQKWEVHSRQDARRWLETYGAVILSFMGGVHWGSATAVLAKGRGMATYLGSIVPALIGWAAVNVEVPGGVSSFGALTGGFVWVFAHDVSGAIGGRLPGWFLPYRLLLTVIVTTCLQVAERSPATDE
jgi:hypothetical protein